MSETAVTVWSKLPHLCEECTHRQVLGLLVGRGLRTTGKRRSCHRVHKTRPRTAVTRTSEGFAVERPVVNEKPMLPVFWSIL